MNSGEKRVRGSKPRRWTEAGSLESYDTDVPNLVSIQPLKAANSG